VPVPSQDKLRGLRQEQYPAYKVGDDGGRGTGDQNKSASCWIVSVDASVSLTRSEWTKAETWQNSNHCWDGPASFQAPVTATWCTGLGCLAAISHLQLVDGMALEHLRHVPATYFLVLTCYGCLTCSAIKWLLLLFIFLIHHFITFTIQITLFLTLWVGRQEEHLACKKWVMRCWRGYLCEVRCKWFAYGPADATATPSSLASLTSRLFDLSGAGLSRLSWKRGC